jgi:hypothetical protein
MGGFKDETYNNSFDVGVINIIISHLIKCSKHMNADYVTTDSLLENDEDVITNRLVEKYLNIETEYFRYETQSPEHYDDETGRYIGRTDIKVISRDYLRNPKAYHIIECKRIDGTNSLNQKYITEGVERFFSPAPYPKYSSYYLQNIMFGYVVRAISISDNACKIDRLQNTLLRGATATSFILNQNDATLYYVYKCKYESNSIGQVQLSHLFFDFSSAICKN